MSYKIPFDKNGQQPYPWEYAEGFRWVDNHGFDATLTFDGYYRGRSAGGFRFKDNLYTYYMFMKDIDQLIKGRVLEYGKVTGTWTFIKRGMNYGIKLVG